MFIEESEDDEGVEQHFVEEQTMEKEHKGGENYWGGRTSIPRDTCGVQQAREVQANAEAQWRAMEMERREVEVVVKRRRVILDIITLLEKGIKILDPKHFMWT